MSAVGYVAVAGQIVVVGAGAPLLTGWMRQVRARLEGRAGAGVLQPWRDVRKLLRKEPITPSGPGPPSARRLPCWSPPRWWLPRSFRCCPPTPR